MCHIFQGCKWDWHALNSYTMVRTIGSILISSPPKVNNHILTTLYPLYLYKYDPLSIIYTNSLHMQPVHITCQFLFDVAPRDALFLLSVTQTMCTIQKPYMPTPDCNTKRWSGPRHVLLLKDSSASPANERFPRRFTTSAHHRKRFCARCHGF
jgi:hypothetical protein